MSTRTSMGIVSGHNCDNETQHYGPRIVGGEDASPSELPFQVSIQHRNYREGEMFKHLCGGAIIDNAHVLTAAHCLKGISATDLKVVAGVLENTVDSSEETKVVLDVTELYIHEQFNDSPYINDIAIIKVSPNFPTDNRAVKPIKLRKEDAPDKVRCTVSGWGRLGGDDKTFPQKLQVAYVYLIPYEKCRNKRWDNIPLSIQPGMICAESIGKDRETGACKGDSGGPLQSEGLLTGIVSWGGGKPLPIYPDVYTDVAYYKEWIEEHLR